MPPIDLRLADGIVTARPLDFRRTLAGVWAAYPVRDYALTIRCRAEGYVFRGTAHPVFAAAVAAANTWWTDQLRAVVVVYTDARRAA